MTATAQTLRDEHRGPARENFAVLAEAAGLAATAL